MLAENGGFILHFDGTCDGGSPHLLVAVDELEQIVLGSVKAPSESAETVVSLLEQVKKNHGDPLCIINDLSKANISAATSVFPGIKIYVCHFHFLRDIGKDLFGYEDAQVRSILHSYGVKGSLKELAKKLRGFIDVEKLQPLTAVINPKALNNLSKSDMTYLLFEWILDL